jgi:crotonobetainyl-CoA:carnitine CoA-transferase CaiB-like acyl-CoA transferase
MYLADMGATVVKVEPPQGELARGLGPPWHNGESLAALTSNRGKLGLSIDLKHPDGAKIVRKLASQVDIVIENFRPGVAERLGIDHATLSSDNPMLITCSLSAYGQNSPWRDRPGVDGTVQAASGLMSGMGAPDDDPAKVPLPLADMTGALYATIAILGALHRRGRSGEGARLDVSLFNGMLMLQQLNLASFLNSGTLPERLGSAAPYASPNEALPTSDGWIMVAAYQDVRWRRLCALIGRPELADDPRFITNAMRVAERSMLFRILAPVFRTRPSADWQSVLQAADILAAPIADFAEVTASDAYRASGVEIAIDDAKGGALRMPGFAIGEPASAARMPPPQVGEHSRVVLSQFGFKADEIDTLIDHQIIFQGDRS